MIELRDIPIPPSENQLYRNVPMRGRVKAQGYRDYESQFFAWCFENKQALLSAKNTIQLLEASQRLRLRLDFKFLESRLISKKGSMKRLDVTNRLKCLIDLVCFQLGFDDSRFFEVHCKKRTVFKEGVDLVIDFADQSPLL